MENNLHFWHEEIFDYSIWEYLYEAVETSVIRITYSRFILLVFDFCIVQKYSCMRIANTLFKYISWYDSLIPTWGNMGKNN
jgi:hypothetical protein